MKKIVRKLFFDWIVYVPISIVVVFYFICFEELFIQIKNNSLKTTSIIIIAYSFLNVILDSFTVFSIEENQWEDFKMGLDYHIDRMVNSMIMRSKILILLMLLWTGSFIYIFF